MIRHCIVILVSAAAWSFLPFSAGAKELGDLARVDQLSEGRVHLTFGSALDLFGGTGVRYSDCVAWNRKRSLAVSVS